MDSTSLEQPNTDSSTFIEQTKEPQDQAPVLRVVRRVKLSPPRLKTAETFREIYVCEPEEGTEFESLLIPEFWAHVTKLLRPRTRIEVYPSDNSYFAELLVQSVEKTEARVAVLSFVDLTKAQASVKHNKEDFEIKFKGPTIKHVIIRKSDNTIVKDGLSTKADAAVWLENYVG